MTDSIDALLRDYIAMWNETDETRRRGLIERACAETCTFLDRNDAATGHAALDGLIRQLQTRAPGLQFRLVEPVDAHHNVVRFHWSFGVPGAPKPAASGLDVGVIESGRLLAIYNFIDRPAG